MCPSYRVTRDERDVTRGRANTLRLAITGQLGPDALTSDEMAETLKLCVSCKACRRECPTGVDMARMKIEVLRARAEKLGLSLHDRLVGYLPRYAPYAARLPWLLNLRDVVPGAAKLSEAIAGFSARRSLPKWRADYFRDADSRDTETGGEVVLFADTFNRYFERENIDAALAVLSAAGYRVRFATPPGRRPAAVLRPDFSLRRQGRRGAGTKRAHAGRARALCRTRRAGHRPRAELPVQLPRRNPGAGEERYGAARCRAARCCSRNFWRAKRRPGRSLSISRRSKSARCCTAIVIKNPSIRCRRSRRAETRSRSRRRDHRIELLRHGRRFRLSTPTRSRCRAPWASCRCCRRCARRRATRIIVADGTSCRHQIHDGAGREAMHVARVLATALPSA